MANWASLKQHLVDQLTGNAEGAHEVTGFDSSPADFVAFFSRDPAILICLTQAHSSVGLSTEKNSIKIRNSTDSQMAPQY